MIKSAYYGQNHTCIQKWESSFEVKMIENEIVLSVSPGEGFNCVKSCGQISVIFTIVK